MNRLHPSDAQPKLYIPKISRHLLPSSSISGVNMHGEFIPLQILIPSLDNAPRIYFLYRRAAESGSSGAMLRFESFRRSLPKSQVRKIEAFFGGSGLPDFRRA